MFQSQRLTEQQKGVLEDLSAWADLFFSSLLLRLLLEVHYVLFLQQFRPIAGGNPDINFV
jgi:hypothetical protein